MNRKGRRKNARGRHQYGGGQRQNVNYRDEEGRIILTSDSACPSMPVAALKVTDRLLAARPGSQFQRSDMKSDMKLVQYAEDVSEGLSGTPNIDQNPYNFAPWIGQKPTGAEKPDRATHDVERQDRRSGSIDVTFTARTPVFMPAGAIEDTKDKDTKTKDSVPQEFFRCWDGSAERYAIPGASVKGAVRSLFETLTNSRAGVTDETTLKHALRQMGKFAARAPDRSKLTGSDPAEVTFGFVGTHSDGSHPFRGRVRFGTFWGPNVTEDLKDRPSVRLMPLTSPTGTKAKAPPLYYEQQGAKLRGRKVYWHQKAGNGDIPSVHRLDKLEQSVPQEWKNQIESQLPKKPIMPLPAGTEFRGTVHFSNLTDSELGALLIALQPDLAFVAAQNGQPQPRYGLKIGKGKPRGLGSVASKVQLRIDDSAENRYAPCRLSTSTPAGAPLKNDEEQPATYVSAYKRALTVASSTEKWEDLDLAKALKRLLRLPDDASVRVYPPQFAMYRPQSKAMTPAHEM